MKDFDQSRAQILTPKLLEPPFYLVHESKDFSFISREEGRVRCRIRVFIFTLTPKGGGDF